MSSIRLSLAMRQAIAVRVLAHRFRAEVAALCAQHAKLATDFYNRAYSPAERTRMKRLPEGWLPESGHLQVVIGEHYKTLDFAGTVRYSELAVLLEKGGKPKAMKRRLWAIDVAKARRYSVTDPLAIAFDKHANQEKALQEQVQTAKSELLAALNRATTLEGLIKMWPEVKPFVDVAQASPTTSILPVIPLETLNAKLGLPVKSSRA